MPTEAEIRATEEQFYNRMLRNAFFGFAKSAMIGAAIGLGLGLLAAGGVALGMTIPFVAMEGSGLAAAMVVGVKWALAFATVSGGFGAVAGIQSTRDTRRFMLLHESPELKSKQTGLGKTPEPALAQSSQPEFSTPSEETTPAHNPASFQNRLAEQARSQGHTLH